MNRSAPASLLKHLDGEEIEEESYADEEYYTGETEYSPCKFNIS